MVDYIYQGNPGLKISLADLKPLFSFATAKTHFLFNGVVYDQIDGVAMGSPLAPILANLFMGHHEKTWLENYTSSVLFYGGNVDDTFCLFDSENEAYLRFTTEREVGEKLPFLDALIDNNWSSPVTSIDTL